MWDRLKQLKEKVLKLDFKKDKTVIFSLAAVVFVIFILLYLPLIKSAGVLKEELKETQKKVSLAKGMIPKNKSLAAAGHLLNSVEISAAIGEITTMGRSLSVNFNSLNPQGVEPGQNVSYQILPLQIEIESKYEDLGRFLGKLEELKTGIVTIRSFQIQKNAQNPSLVKAKIVLEMYLKGS